VLFYPTLFRRAVRWRFFSRAKKQLKFPCWQKVIKSSRTSSKIRTTLWKRKCIISNRVLLLFASSPIYLVGSTTTQVSAKYVKIATNIQQTRSSSTHQVTATKQTSNTFVDLVRTLNWPQKKPICSLLPRSPAFSTSIPKYSSSSRKCGEDSVFWEGIMHLWSSALG